MRRFIPAFAIGILALELVSVVGAAPGTLAVDPAAHLGQFVLTQDADLLPAEWSLRALGGWHNRLSMQEGREFRILDQV